MLDKASDLLKQICLSNFEVAVTEHEKKRQEQQKKREFNQTIARKLIAQSEVLIVHRRAKTTNTHTDYVHTMFY